MLWIFLNFRTVEYLLQDLLDCSLPVLDDFRFMVVEPILLQIFLRSDSEVTFVGYLHSLEN